MTESIADQLNEDMQCEGLLACLHGLKPLDTVCYRATVESDGALTVDEVADRVGRERSTAYRSIQRLFERGLVEQEQINDAQGGYHHVYFPRDPHEIARDLRRLLNDWYGTMGLLIHEFEDNYGRVEEPATPDTE